jgi:hypothetical protein
LKKIKDIPLYVKKLIQENPKIVSKRKNFSDHHKRIVKTIIFIKKYFKIKN